LLSLAVAAALGAGAGLISTSAYAQEPDASEAPVLEEVIVVGSQIRGASISSALSVSVLDARDIESMGVESGAELFQLIPENGQNFFNEAENISGGVNSGRGDVGAFNLRNIGTGNTLVLLNGRRLVNSAAYQTEEVGGSFVPVNTVNSQTLPVFGIERVEVLRDGASAIYGADAVAGVVNTVLKDDFEGFNLRLRHTEFDNIPSDRQTVTVEWGSNFNDGRTNVGVFANYFQRDRIQSIDDDRWANSDFRDRIPEGSPWAGNTLFRNDSANSEFPQLDIISSLPSSHSLRTSGLVDNAGELETYPVGDERCQYVVNGTTCGAADGQGTFRHNFNSAFGTGRDLSSELTRINLFTNINHQFESGLESFTELMYYESRTNTTRHASAPFSSSRLELGRDNPYNPFGSGPGRLSGPEFDAAMADVPAEGYDVLLDNYRFAVVPRIVDNDGETYRFLQGFRGSYGDWDWESAVSYSKAEKEDITRNRQSNTLAQEALNDSSLDAYNPLDPTREGSNVDRVLVDVFRKSETELTTFDIKLSNANLFELPAGPVGGLVGFEWREESFVDDRDPRLDGTIVFTDRDGDSFPFVSDVVNSSPTPDSSGSRRVNSAFVELQVPVLKNLDVQLALRHEAFSDISKDATVGKFAFGYRPFEMLLIRGSWSEAFRVPNLVTVNEGQVARSNTRTDWACVYANDNSGEVYDLDCVNPVQRVASGADDLVPETSTNTSFGFVLDPLEGLTITADFWQIEKDDTIGLFGEENHTILDLVERIEAGLANCSQDFNTNVVRLDADDDQVAAYTESGICPGGDVNRIEDSYANLDTRTVRGFDIGIYYDIDTEIGDFRFTYNGSFLEKFEQTASGDALRLVQAQESGVLPASYPVEGFADLLGRDGNQEDRHAARLTWRMGQFGAGLAAYRVGSFYQSSLTLDDGTRYNIPAFTTYDVTADYRFKIVDTGARLRIGIRNFTNERAPLADRFFGFFADAHTDYGRFMYADLKLNF
jgi:iron complex outermembrane receptor protein